MYIAAPRSFAHQQRRLSRRHDPDILIVSAQYPDEFAYEVENTYFIVACDEGQAQALVAAVCPMLVKSGGVCRFRTPFG